MAFLIDWVSFSSKIDSVDSIVDFLGLSEIDFEITNGFHGYRDSIFFNGIRIHYNPRTEEMGILVDLSGTGCRAFETYGTGDFNSIFNLIVENQNDYNITRLDVAFDDKEDLIPIMQLKLDTEKMNWVSRWGEWEVRNSSKGVTVNLGSSSSDTFLRIYDKAAERGFVGEDYFHWVRLELQLRRDRAFQFVKMLNTDNIGELWCGVVNNYIRFVKPSLTDTNKARWSVRPYWTNLINNAIKVKLYVKPGEEYNIHNLERYVFKQAVGAIKTSIKILGEKQFIEKLNHTKMELNPKYKRLINENITYKKRIDENEFTRIN